MDKKITQYKQDDIAKWLLSIMSMSPKKLQKMLYYSYSWVLTLTNDDINHLDNRLFDNQFQAWAHGPVLPQIYSKYKEYGFNDIDIPKEVDDIDFPNDILDILKQVIDIYGGYTADELESITHQELPWIDARKGLGPLEAGNKEITDKEIFKYYIKRVG